MSYPNKPENNGWVDEDYEEMSEDDLEYQRDSYNDYPNYLWNRCYRVGFRTYVYSYQ